MAHGRRHRGPHPQDEELFSAAAVPRLREAVADLSWLRTRGYAEPSATKIVGDRYQLRARQRTAVGRCACPDGAASDRTARRVAESDVRGEVLMIDGLNALTTIEVALAHGVLLIGRDHCMRDMASFHGNYRLVHETNPAIDWLLDALGSLEPRRVEFLIDRPVSNSGRLAGAIRDAASERGAEVHPVLSNRVDATLKASREAIVATADSAILDACGPWLNLARLAIDRREDLASPLWLLDLG